MIPSALALGLVRLVRLDASARGQHETVAPEGFPVRPAGQHRQAVHRPGKLARRQDRFNSPTIGSGTGGGGKGGGAAGCEVGWTGAWRSVGWWVVRRVAGGARQAVFGPSGGMGRWGQRRGVGQGCGGNAMRLWRAGKSVRDGARAGFGGGGRRCRQGRDAMVREVLSTGLGRSRARRRSQVGAWCSRVVAWRVVGSVGLGGVARGGVV